MYQRESYVKWLVVGLCWLGACREAPPTIVSPWRASTQPVVAQPRAEVSVVSTRDARAETTVQIFESTHTLTGTNLRMADLISIAYRSPEDPHSNIPLLSAVRVKSTAPLATGRYDIRVVVPRGNAEQLRAALRTYLEQTHGFTVRPEVREAEVYVLTAPRGELCPNPAATPAADETHITLTGDRLALLAEQLEEWMQQPVVNETGAAGPYHLRLPRTIEPGRFVPIKPQTARTAVREQLGLDLIPARRAIEFLVVQN